MSDLCELAQSYIRSIAPYQPGKPISDLAREMGLKPENIVKLASNENPLGPSPKAYEAMQEAIGDIARYPDGGNVDLRAAVAEKFNLGVNQLVFGNGSNDILELAARTFLVAGDEAVFSQHAFAVYPLVTQAVGAKGIAVPAKDYAHDLDAMYKAITAKTRLIFIANPNNPTGTLIDKASLKAFIDQVPRSILVVLDEAYDEYLSELDKSEALNWLAEFPHLLVSRSFSKAYGLAGLRLGFGATSPGIADLINRVRQPFNINSIAQAAGVAALHDHDYLARSRALNQAGMEQVTQGLSELKLEFIPSYGNFVSFKVGDGAAVYQSLLKQGVIVRPIANYGMPEYLRVSIGLFSENERFLMALKQAITA